MAADTRSSSPPAASSSPKRRAATEGLEQAVTLLPDLIVLDFGLDGELVARLRANVATSAIPIIALTDVCRLRRSEN